MVTSRFIFPGERFAIPSSSASLSQSMREARRATTRLLLALIFILTLMQIATQQSIAVPANPRPITTVQPDGSAITIHIIGDEWYHFYESLEGYAIMQKGDGWWVYAALDQTGRYTPSEFRVNDTSPPALGFLQKTGRHLREDMVYRMESRNKFFKGTLPQIVSIAQQKAIKNVLVLLVQYTDFAATQTAASFDNMMNQANYNGTGSFKDYYLEVSYNLLTVNATVVNKWYKSPHNRKYNEWYNANRWTRSRELVRALVDSADADVNYANYDNDGDGSVDAVFVVHQGPGAEEGDSSYIWSHSWSLSGSNPNLSVTHDGVKIDRYIIMPELVWGGHATIGVFCHEYGHVLGLPDLYDYGYDSWGVGNWSLMGFGSWGFLSPATPTHLDAWCKMRTGFLAPTNMVVNTTGVSIPQVETNSTVYRLWINGTNTTQYFLVENRQKVGFDKDMPTSGLAIWHVDETKLNNGNNNDENHKLVDLEEADNLLQLDSCKNQGNAGDLYPGSTNNTNFNNTTSPNSKDYNNGNTNVCVNNISASGNPMTADMCVSSAGPPDFLIRDCTVDVGAQPDLPCSGNWVQSPDIWIDNNDDSTMDEPVKGQVNHLYVRAFNLGGLASNIKVNCWYVNPSLGLTFPGHGTQIIDNSTGSGDKYFASMDHNMPHSGPPYTTVYFNWLVPTPPPDIDHYCIGCIVSHALDPPRSDVPLNDNSLGQINYWAFALKKGQVPANYPLAAGVNPQEITIFRERVEVNNPYPYPRPLMMRAIKDSMPPGWTVLMDTVPFVLAPGEIRPYIIDVINNNPTHMDRAHLYLQLRTYPDDSLKGGLVHDYRIDDVPPAMVGCFKVDRYDIRGNNPPPGLQPTIELTWCAPMFDTLGFPEKVNFYYIYRSIHPTFTYSDSELVDSTAEDRDLDKPGYQWWDYVNTRDSIYYYSVLAVDKAHSKGIPSAALTYPITVAQGIQSSWNMISVPVVISEKLKRIIYPTATSNAYIYDQTYRQKDSLECGDGVWLKFPDADTLYPFGGVVSKMDIPVKKGWNLIGTISTPVPVGAITSSPPGIITGSFFGYSSGLGYTPAATLVPGKAYWGKMSQNGVLYLEASSIQPKNNAADQDLGLLDKLLIQDASNHQQTLYIGPETQGVPDPTTYELPPLPPDNIFDARYSSQRFVEVYPPSSRKSLEYLISIRTTAYPVTVTFESATGRRSGDYTLWQLTNGHAAGGTSLKDKSTMVINNPGVQTLLLRVEVQHQFPTEFALYQCYPNPFNPLTTIKFDVPNKSIVNLSVYDLLGRELSQLIKNATYEAGTFEVEFNAGEYGSGVYFYRISALSGEKHFTNVKKMLYMK